MARPPYRWPVRATAAFVGFACAVGILASNRVPPTWGTIGATINIAVHRSGSLEVIPTGNFVSSTNLQPDTHTMGTTQVRNITERTQTFRLGLTGPDNGLDHGLNVRVDVNHHTIFCGLLGTLRASMSQPVVLRPGRTATIHIDASLDHDPRTVFRGQILDTQLVFTPRKTT